MDKEVWVEFSEEANNDYQELLKNISQEKEQGVENSFNMQLLKSIDRAKDNLKIDPQFGIHIPRKSYFKGSCCQVWNRQIVEN